MKVTWEICDIVGGRQFVLRTDVSKKGMIAYEYDGVEKETVYLLVSMRDGNVFREGSATTIAGFLTNSDYIPVELSQ